MSNTVDLRQLQTFVSQCDPQQPLDAGDPRYVKLDEGAPVRGSDGWSCIEEIERTIQFSDAASPVCQLFTGFPGTGKTTELRRLARRLDENKLVPLHTLLIDFEKYRTAYSPISIMDMLRVLAYELDCEATRVEGGDPTAGPSYLRRFFDFVASTDLQLKTLGFQQLGASMMLELKDNPTFRREVETALARRFQVFARDAQESMAESVVRIRKATNAQQIVVIGDSLEKISPLREEDRDFIESSVETLFVEHASWLRLPCHAVYTFPLWLPFRTAELDTRYDRKIADPAHGQGDGARRAALRPRLREAHPARRQAPRLGLIFGPDLEQTFFPLVAASGGYARDLLRMMREILWSARSFPVSPAQVQRVIDQTAESYARTIRSADVDVMAEVARTHELPRGDGDRMAVFGRLLQRWLVLAYRNGKEWYDFAPACAPGAHRPGASRGTARTVTTKTKAAPTPAWLGPYLPAFEELLRVVELSSGFVLLPLEVSGPDSARAFGDWLAGKGHPATLIPARRRRRVERAGGHVAEEQAGAGRSGDGARQPRAAGGVRPWGTQRQRAAGHPRGSARLRAVLVWTGELSRCDCGEGGGFPVDSCSRQAAGAST